MSEVKNPMIKLFGKTISFPANQVVDFDHDHGERKQERCSTVLDDKISRRKLEVDIIKKTEDESVKPETPSRTSETLKPPVADTKTSSPNVTNNEEQSETSAFKETTLKKPDKILPCARCNSLDTKFCYYNNNNVNQPRHFCKNCQRYWTAGGTMRNVPVGSGRRKNKSSCVSSYIHTTVSVASHVHLSPLEADGAVHAFRSERPLSESMAYAFIQNGFRGNETEMNMDHLNGSCCMSLELSGKQGQGNASSLHQDSVFRIHKGYTSQMPYFSETPMHSGLNAAIYSSSASQHGFSPSSFPVAVYPAIHLCGFTGQSPWNVQYPLSTNPFSPSGKRHRNGSTLKSNSSKSTPVKDNDEPCPPMLPKDLTIHDVNGTPESSTRLPMRIKTDNKDSRNGESILKAFYPKDDSKNHIVDTSLVLQANPAALSRSVNFHESA